MLEDLCNILSPSFAKLMNASLIEQSSLHLTTEFAFLASSILFAWLRLEAVCMTLWGEKYIDVNFSGQLGEREWLTLHMSNRAMTEEIVVFTTLSWISFWLDFQCACELSLIKAICGSFLIAQIRQVLTVSSLSEETFFIILLN